MLKKEWVACLEEFNRRKLKIQVNYEKYIQSFALRSEYDEQPLKLVLF